MAAVGSRVSLYSEWIGTPSRGWRACAVSTMLSWTSAWKPCCGPNSAARVAPGASAMRSATCLKA